MAMPLSKPISFVFFLVLSLLLTLAVDFNSQPRFDETGYAILGLSLAQGQGYREIDKPDSPLHAHFPPGWPIALAATWRMIPPQIVSPTLSAHALVIFISACSLLLWSKWFVRTSGPQAAAGLAFALFANWFWIRLAGELRSESLFILLSAVAFLLVDQSNSPQSLMKNFSTGCIIGLAILTRQAAVALLAAIVVHELTQRHFRTALCIGASATLTISPWLWWIATSGKPAQASLIASDEQARSLSQRLIDQSLFYLIRLPDSLFGPFLETATIFRPSPALKSVAYLFAALFFVVFSIGIVSLTKQKATRLAAIYLLISLLMLVAWPFTEAGRFLIPLVPLVLLASAAGVEKALALSKFMPQKSTALLAPWLVAAASLPFGVYTWQKQCRIESQPQDRDFNAACHWITQNLPEDAIIASRHPGDVYWRSGRRGVVWPENASIDQSYTALNQQNAACLLVDTSRYAKMIIPDWCRPGLISEKPDFFREISPEGWSAEAIRLYQIIPRASSPPPVKEK
jgi:hypothetical protein